MQVHIIPKQLERFLSLIDQSGGPDACWEYQGQRDRHGYGRIGIFYKEYFAHRIAYMVFCGDIPDGKGILHSCDNPPCCNPNHLRPGTQKDNIVEASLKGRLPRPNPARGGRHGRAILTESKVLSLREEYAAGGITQGKIAEKYGVSMATAQKIILRKLWRHI